MATLVFHITKRTKRVSQNVQKPLCWYNFDTHKMQHDTGGTYQFDYDTNTKTVSAKPVPLKCVAYQLVSDRDDILKWIELRKSEFGLEIIEKGTYTIVVTADDDSVADIENDLSDRDFVYDIT